ncbi:protein kinase domain-containing protein [Tundrisphaera lichenicola]|uniref:protein kinase domain-containing protein n=1 Tax=Tundrisphaera lichenicola TaxID=2029860 RepID=UPI003EB88002
MIVEVLCPQPGCGAAYGVDDRSLGQESRCQRCGHRFPLIPQTKADSSATAPFGADLPSTEGIASQELPPRFGRYRIIRLIGRGGMGSVYLAEDTRLERRVALKVPRIVPGGSPEVGERFLREARAAARFRHPSFCPIHDIGEVDGVPYLTMAFLEGQTLASMIEPGRPWPERRAAEVVRRLALALAEAHRQGVIHRDLKPANVMIESHGGLVLMDFGLARFFDGPDPTITANGAIMGTPAYMSPEQAEGDQRAIGPRSDLYSLGVILYELLTTRRPFEGSTARILGLIACADPPPPSASRPSVDRRLEATCLKAMARRPGDRYASMEEFARAIDTWLGSDPLVPTTEPEQADYEGPKPPAKPGPTPSAINEPSSRRAHTRGFRLSIHAWGFKLTLAVVGLLMIMVTGTFLTQQRAFAPRHAHESSHTIPPTSNRPLAKPEPESPIDIPFALIPTRGAGIRAVPEEIAYSPDGKGVIARSPLIQVQPFEISAKEITQAQYQAFEGENPSQFQGHPDHPVENVSWMDAVKFCNWLSQREGREPYYELDPENGTVQPRRTIGYRLPTEAEWEYACNSQEVNGRDLSPAKIAEVAWLGLNSEGSTHPVGRLTPNRFGLFDTRGNVEEWCFDEGTGPVSGDLHPARIARGGSWASDPGQILSAARSVHPQDHKNGTIGFRVARDVR